MKCSPLLSLMVLLCLSSALPSVARSAPVPQLLELEVKGIMTDPNSQAPVVILEAPASHKAFPIWIGRPEARAIAIEIEEVPTARPLTHRLLKNILSNLHVKVQHIVIHDVRDQTFYASISLQHGSTRHTIDARPSDAIALALGAKAPIFVAATVLKTVRTIPLAASKPPPIMGKQFGMHMQNLNRQLAQAFHFSTTEGVLVAYVESGSSAARYGVRRGDLISRVDDHPIKTVRDILAAFTKSGTHPLTLRMTRDQTLITLQLHPASLD